jgi:hypothetical protein
MPKQEDSLDSYQVERPIRMYVQDGGDNTNLPDLRDVKLKSLDPFNINVQSFYPNAVYKFSVEIDYKVADVKTMLHDLGAFNG